jgi:hypothetical protein
MLESEKASHSHLILNNKIFVIRAKNGFGINIKILEDIMTFLRKLGRSGIQVSAMGMGCWAIGGPFWRGDVPVGWGDVDDDESIRAVHTCLDSVFWPKLLKAVAIRSSSPPNSAVYSMRLPARSLVRMLHQITY